MSERHRTISSPMRNGSGWTMLQKVVVAVALASMVGMTGFLARVEFERISRTAHEANAGMQDNRREIAVLKTMERRLERIEVNQDEILRILRNSD